MFPNPIWKYVEASPHQYPAGVQESSSILKLSTRDRIRFHRKRPPSKWLSDNLPANAGDTGLIPGSGWSTGEGDGYLFQYPGKFHGQRSLASHSPWDCKESDKTEYTHTPTCTHTYTQTHKVTLLFRHQSQVQVVTSASCCKSEVPTTFFLGSINLLEWLIELWKTYLLSRLPSFLKKILKDRNQ